MKRCFFIVAVLVVSIGLNVQAQNSTRLAKATAPRTIWSSPPDTVRGVVDKDVSITVAYSQPSLKGRKIGTADFLPYGKVWRLGANEATTIEFGSSGSINGKPIPEGKYGLYAIPGEIEWVFIFDSVWKASGLDYTSDEGKGAKTDVLRITVKAEKAAEFSEKLKFTIIQSGGPGKVYFVWGDVKVGFTVG